MTSLANGVFDILREGNTGKPNILVLTEHVNATYFISFDRPLGAMHGRGELNFAVASQARVDDFGLQAWDIIRSRFRPDLVVFTRFGLPSGVAFMRLARNKCVPVVYHIDDDLLDLPDSLGADIMQRNGSLQVKEARRELLSNADLVYASTAALAERMRTRFPHRDIFHGIYASYPGDVDAASGNAARVIGYMGSRGHAQDLELVVPALCRLMTRMPELRFETFGTIAMPQALAPFGPRVTSHPVSKSYGAFLEQLSRLSWAVGLAPLVDEPFNRCKAPTKFIEYTAAGIPVVASDVVVYRDVVSESGGGVLVGDDWETAIDGMLESPGKSVEMVKAARNYCRSRFAPELLEAQLRTAMARVGVRCP
ncbi:MAG: glycosyltransferase [Thermomonas sp.]|uniref:glycosyltransferase n=1 Tax=Thermomonas sp. TaxID=1971895 RepID=UPI0039E2E217